VSDSSEYSLRIERTFNASAEEVFDAWTSPEVMRRWFHCRENWSTPEVEVDLRVGGHIRVVMRHPDATEEEMGGTFTSIDRPRHLAMTWTFSEEPSDEQALELCFSESGGRTTVVLVNRRIGSGERRDLQHTGWQGCFDELARHWFAGAVV